MANGFAPVSSPTGVPTVNYAPQIVPVQQYNVASDPSPQQQQPTGGGGSFLNSVPNNPFSGSFFNGTNGIDTIGTSMGFGAGNAALYSAPIGPMASGAPMAASYTAGANTGALTGASLSQTLGAAGLGYFGGGIVSGMLGLNEKTGSVGGGVGAGIGMAVGGPPGAIVGGLLGSIGGGLFGNTKPSDKTQSGGVSIANGEVNRYYADSQSQTGKKFSGQNAQIRDQLENSVSSFSKFLLANGATPIWAEKENRDVIVQYGSRDGYKWWFEGADKPNNYGNNYQGFSKSLMEETMQQYNIPDALKEQLSNMPMDDILKFGKAQSQQNKQQRLMLGNPGNIPIPAKEDTGKETFDQFLTNYRSKYNAGR